MRVLGERALTVAQADRDAPGTPWRRAAQLRELVLHLAGRQLRSTHRRTLLGWSWPLLLQLVQLAVLVFVFKKVIPLNIPDYPTFVFTGLVFWSWFQAGILSASSSVTDNSALVTEPRLPRAVLPLVAVAVAGFDVLVALPVLLGVVGLTVGLSPVAAFVIVLLLIQAALMVGIALIASALHVYVRDTKPLVGVILLITFYLTPIFYSFDSVPSGFSLLLRFNPAATLIDGYHRIFIFHQLPPWRATVLLAAGSIGVVAAGAALFRRLQGGFVDEL
jgi:lipopolysaccharide transport system permease protein